MLPPFCPFIFISIQYFLFILPFTIIVGYLINCVNKISSLVYYFIYYAVIYYSQNVCVYIWQWFGKRRVEQQQFNFKFCDADQTVAREYIQELLQVHNKYSCTFEHQILFFTFIITSFNSSKELTMIIRFLFRYIPV